MKSLIAKFKFLLVLLIFLSNNSWSSNSSRIIERNLDNSIIKEIENAFLFNEKEQNSIDNNLETYNESKSKIKQEKSKFGFTASGNSVKKVDIDKKTKERVAYYSYINGQYEVALKIYKDLTIKYPADNYPKYCLALTYQKLKQFRKAKVIYFELLKDNPENKEEIVGNLVAALSQENPSRALFLLTKLVNQNPGNGYFLAQKALIFEQMNKIHQAINTMKKATTIEPANIEFKLNLAILYDKNKNFEDALMQYQRVLISYKNGEKNTNIPIHQVVSRIDVVKNLI